MFRTSRWFLHEIERRDRAHAAERAELIATIAHLAGKPLPLAAPAEPDVDPDDVFDFAPADYPV